jgi:SAM-dependent methyltransferase
VHASEIQKLVELEDRHWWYRERRHLLAQALRNVPPGRALDVGAAGGGNTRVLTRLGWRAVALEYGAEGARVAADRGLAVLRADAADLPFQSGSLDLVVAFDVLEHLPDDVGAAREVSRVLREGGRFLVAVPADERLWSAHDDAVGHVRRYTRPQLCDTLQQAGFEIADARSWNVLLRPVVAMRRRSSTGSDLERMNPLVNAGLRGVITAERYLPVGRLPGVSLLVRARKP